MEQTIEQQIESARVAYFAAVDAFNDALWLAKPRTYDAPLIVAEKRVRETQSYYTALLKSHYTDWDEQLLTAWNNYLKHK